MTRFRANIPSSEITPESLYMSRRQWMKWAAVGAAGATLAACAPGSSSAGSSAPAATPVKGTVIPGQTDELGNKLNSLADITHYNNYYEFTTSKEDVAPMSTGFSTDGWQVEVGGLVNKPGKFSVDELIKKYSPEERIYRLRCVEAWSMVVPWMGFSLAKLLKDVEPQSGAQYVAFTTLQAPDRFPGQKDPSYPWPYSEGLRLDEAMNDLAIFGTGLYGKPLPAQDGAPIRLVVPWKYGFKSIKAIVTIDLVAEMPKTMWSSIASNEYGFYANVNPQVDHPRWSQATERRIGELGRRPTLMFNGYAEQVASLYTKLDLRANY